MGKHVPTAMNMHATIELLLETVFCTQCVQRGYKEDNWGIPVSGELSLAREAEKRWHYSTFMGYLLDNNSMSTEGEESPLLKTVTKQRLVKTLQTGEDLASTDM
jgi:hypothetical protein